MLCWYSSKNISECIEVKSEGKSPDWWREGKVCGDGEISHVIPSLLMKNLNKICTCQQKLLTYVVH